MLNLLDIKYFMCVAFHVEHCGTFLVPQSFMEKQPEPPAYLPMRMSNTLISLGETPGMRLA